MADMMARARQQGLDERQEQLDARNRVLEARQKDMQKQAVIDKINQNKIAFFKAQQQLKAEQALQPKIGLPEMPHVDQTQQERQANQHQDQVFVAAKEMQRFRMGQEQINLAQAEKKHGFALDAKEADKRVLEAANAPIKTKDLDKELTKQEKQMRAVFKNPNIPFKKKVEFFKNAIRGVKGQKTLKGEKQIQRGKRLMKEVNPQTRRQIKKLKNKEMANIAINTLGRCA